MDGTILPGVSKRPHVALNGGSLFLSSCRRLRSTMLAIPRELQIGSPSER